MTAPWQTPTVVLKDFPALLFRGMILLERTYNNYFLQAYRLDESVVSIVVFDYFPKMTDTTECILGICEIVCRS